MNIGSMRLTNGAYWNVTGVYTNDSFSVIWSYAESQLHLVVLALWFPSICNTSSVFAYLYHVLNICEKWSEISLNIPEFIFILYFHIMCIKLFNFWQGYHINYITFILMQSIKVFIVLLFFIICNIKLYHLVRVVSAGWEFLFWIWDREILFKKQYLRCSPSLSFCLVLLHFWSGNKVRNNMSPLSPK